MGKQLNPEMNLMYWLVEHRMWEEVRRSSKAGFFYASGRMCSHFFCNSFLLLNERSIFIEWMMYIKWKICQFKLLLIRDKNTLKIHSYYAWVAADNVQKFPQVFSFNCFIQGNSNLQRQNHMSLLAHRHRRCKWHFVSMEINFLHTKIEDTYKKHVI